MLPKYALIEPTSICNLRCVSCFREDLLKNGMPVGSIDRDFLKELYSTLPSLEHIRFHGMGELFLLKEYYVFLEDLRRYYPRAWIELVTNGQVHGIDWNFVSTKVNKVTFSMSGASTSKYESFHVHGKWKTLIDNIQMFSATNENPESCALEVNFVCTSENYTELQSLVKLALILGVSRVRVNIYQTWVTEEVENKKLDLNNIEEDVVREIVMAIRLGEEINLPVDLVGNPDFSSARCEWLEKRVMVSYDGALLPCCMRPERKWLEKNLFDADFSAFWGGDKIADMKNMRSKKELDMCDSCPYEVNKKILNRIKEELRND